MKRVLIIFFLLSILPLASALTLNLPQNIQPGQTLLGSLEGNFISPITEDNFYFYSDREPIPADIKVGLINNKYYFYANFQPIARNYTLVIKNLHYLDIAEKYGDIERNFTVSGNYSDFFINPGFIISNNNFTIKVSSLNSPVDISASFSDSQQSVSLIPGQTKELFFSAKPNASLSELSLSSANTNYLVPVSLFQEANENTTNTTSSENLSLRFSIRDVNFTLNKNKQDKLLLFLVNNGGDLKNILIGYSSVFDNVISITPQEISQLNASDTAEIDVSVYSDATATYIGKIVAQSGNITTEMLLTINSVDENVTVEPQQTCLAIGGIKCSSNQQCSISDQILSDGPCCLGRCDPIKTPTSYTSTIIGIILIIIVLGGLYLLYKRSQSKKINPKEILNKREKDFEKRMSTEVVSKETKGNLARS